MLKPQASQFVLLYSHKHSGGPIFWFCSSSHLYSNLHLKWYGVAQRPRETAGMNSESRQIKSLAE